MDIWIKREVLSDGSYVFNVHIPHMFIPARDERSARWLADAVAGAIAINGVGDDAKIKTNY